MKKKALLIALLAWSAICIGDIQAQILPAMGMHQNSDEQTPEYDRADANNTYLSGATTKGAALAKATDHEKMTVFGACDLTTYQSAIIIGPNAFPYTSAGSGVTVNATVDVTTLPNTTYSCGGNSFATSSPAWWLNSTAQSIVLNFSVPVTSFSVVINGTNENEIFTFNTATGTISLGNFCTDGFTTIGAGNQLQATTSFTVGTLITVNNPTGSTQYTITHNGVGAGSRISLLDCFEEDPLPYVDPVSNVVACGGEMVSGITFTGTAGATFNWSNNNTATGLAASGTNSIASFTAANVSTQQVSTITVTPVLGAETGTPINFTITVNPKPSLALGTITQPSTCGGTGSIAFVTTNLPNGTYSLSYTGTGSPQNVTVSGNAFVLSGLSAGSYSNFSITHNSCTGSVAGPVNLQNPSFTWYRDMDGDGFGNPAMTQTACAQPTGYVSNNTDCDDNDALEKPGQVWYKDADGDDYSDGMTLTQCLRPTNYYVAAELIATSGDCNDNNAAINPGATEICDGIDNNCNSMTDEGVQTTYYRDMDGDGFGNPSVTQMACSQPTGYVTNNTDCDDNDALEKPGQVWYKDADGDDYSDGMTLTQCLRPTNYYVAAELIATSGDCNDNNAAINPAATEVCDGIDNNCNSMTDEGVQTTYYRDMDGDGFGNPAMTQMACSQPTGYVANNTDCDDNDALEKPGQVWYKDADGDDYSDGMTLTQCLRPTNYYVAAELIATSGDCNDNNAAINPGATEVCDGIDNDCNTMIDDNLTFVTYYTDADNDSYGTGAGQSLCANPGAGFATQAGDCNDNNAAINPGATEICDGIDNNCNMMTDEGVQTTYYRDMDGDGFGNLSVTQMACSQPTGYVANNTDCDDNDPLEKPGQVWYADVDNDGYSSGTTLTQCLRPAGYKVASELTATTGDCNDNNAAINPAATEVCDGIDNNCNSMTDEGVQTTYYRDMDGDGFGNPSVTQMACSQPSGYVANNTDCDDNDALEKPGQVWYADVDNDGYSSGTTLTQCLRPTGYKVASELIATTGDCNDNNNLINPEATEICDGVDNDCNTMIDDNLTFVTYYTDADNDGYGTGAGQSLCANPGPGFATEAGDCNDNNNLINPGATEICDGIDNNCNSMTDEGVQTTYYRDMDGDGFGNPSVTQMACSQPMGYVTDNTDCDDNDALEKPGQVWYKDADGDDYSDGMTLTQCLRPTNYYVAAELIATSGDCNDNNAAINPAATEVCDGIDNNCNSQTDEGVQTTYYRDMDGDGFGNPLVTQMACSQPTGYVTNNTDCDDNDALEKPGQIWYADVDNDGYSSGTTLTQCLRPAGYKVASELTATTGDCNDNNAAINPAATEVCDGVDNNCNMMTDEGVQTTYYRDMDGDGFGNPSVTQMACSQPTGYVTNNTDCDDNDALEKPGQIWHADVDNDGYSSGTTLTQCLRPAGYKVASELTAITGDCNDNNAAINPGATEACDGVDNNCNMMTDEGVQTTWYRDMDGDGFGNPSVSQMACSQPMGYVTNNTDCDDNDALGKPGQVWYADVDNDGYSSGTTLTQCLRPAGYKVASELTATTGDCNDNNAAINPGATEICDGIDNNCNSQTDEGVQTTYYRDMDGDGFGNPSVTQIACSQPTGYVTNNTDCDDNDALEKPGQVWYADIDGDGYSSGATLTQCLRPAGYKVASELTATTGDCNDNNAAINPVALEICNGVDDNCDGVEDEGVKTTYYRDLDGDGFGDINTTTIECSLPTGYVENSDDCDDTDDEIYPGAEEICDSKDNDCNGTIDDIGGTTTGNWIRGDVGDANGSSSFPPCNAEPTDVFTLSSTGFSTSSSDKLHVVYQELCGNGEIIARVLNISGGGWAGIMLRETLNPGSKKVSLKVQANGSIRREIRTVTNGAVNNLNFNRPTHVWLRLTRNGSTFVGYTSPDGSNWTFAFSASVSMNGCIYAGLFSESINASAPTTVTFDNVSIIRPNSNLSVELAQPANLNDQALQLDMNIYPNPGNGEITLTVQSATDRPLNLKVMDAFGKIIRNIELNEGAAFNYSLDLSGEPAGIYYLRLRSDDGEENVQRIVLQR